MLKNLAILVIALTLPACAITQMEAKLDPQVDVTASNEGQGIEVGVSAIDERPTKNLGQRAPGGAQITYSGDLAALLQERIIQGLNQKGFQAIGGAVEGVNIKVEIRSLNYEVSTGWFTGGINVDSAIKVYVNGGGENYENLYRSSNEERIVFVSGAGANNERLNTALQDVLKQLLEDKALLDTLVQASK